MHAWLLEGQQTDVSFAMKSLCELLRLRFAQECMPLAYIGLYSFLPYKSRFLMANAIDSAGTSIDTAIVAFRCIGSEGMKTGGPIMPGLEGPCTGKALCVPRVVLYQATGQHLAALLAIEATERQTKFRVSADK